MPDIELDGAAYPGITVRGASVRGDSHRHMEEPRQDALGVTLLGRDRSRLLLLAVADGVGSMPRSHVGSRLVVRLFAEYLDPHADELLAAIATGDEQNLQRYFTWAVQLVGPALRLRDPDPAKGGEVFATTYRALLVPLDPTIRHRGFFAVGDGGFARLRHGMWDTDLLGDAASASASGVIDPRTAALPLVRSGTTRIVGPTAPGDVYVLSTDGFSLPLAAEPAMADFIARAWGSGEVPAPADFLWQLQFRSKSYDDDRTAVCLWEVGE